MYLFNLDSSLQEKSSAFTLIELLCVLALLGILGGFLLPVYNQSQDKAKSAQIKLECSALAQGIERYYAYYKSFPEFLEKQCSVLLQDYSSEFVQMLNPKDSHAPPLASKNLNPHRQTFYEFPQKYLKKGFFLSTMEAQVPIHIQVRVNQEPIILPDGSKNWDRAIVYTILNNKNVVGSW